MNILLISPYPDLSKLAGDIARETGYNLIIETAVLNRGVELAKAHLQQNHVEVIVSRGPTGSLISAATAVPVIFIEISAFDILNTLYEARRFGDRIALFDYYSHRGKYDFDLMKTILNLEHLFLYYYRDAEELSAHMEQAHRDGVQVVVASGVCIVKMAHNLGMQGVLIRSRREAVVEALQRARQIIALSRQYREANERLTTIIDHTCNGVIVIDKSGVITHFNPVAEQILGAKAEDFIGHSATGSGSRLPVPLEGLKAGQIRVLGKQQYVVNRLPITHKNEDLGTMITFQEITNIQRMEEKIRKELYNKGHVARYRFEDNVGQSRSLLSAIAKARKFGKTDSTVLITGESGTGKELFAQSIHNASARSRSPFIAVNCATLPENLLESELFGYEEGAFTGAKKGGKPGIFELAHRGTIFLDEILDLPFLLQARLLRVLEEKAVRRVGGEKIIPVDVRIIAATNHNLKQAVEAGRFRDDLFFRLNVLNIELPPLRERREDIPLLINFFIKKFQKKYAKKVPLIPKLFVDVLTSYDWPGNIRELENFIEKYVVLFDEQTEQVALLNEITSELYQKRNARPPEDLRETIEIPLGTLQEMELEIIRRLNEGGYTDRETLARKLGISRTTLWSKLKQIANRGDLRQTGSG